MWIAHFDRLSSLGHAIVLAQAAGVALFVMIESCAVQTLPGHRAVA